MDKKLFLILMLLSYNLILHADDLNKSISLTAKANSHSLNTQKKIDSLAYTQEKLYTRYKNLTNELKSVSAYNRELQEIIHSQKQEELSLNEQINKIDDTKRDILPLIKNMLHSLEELVQNDTPFLYKERKQRIIRLKNLLKKSDVSIASKYRAVIEAFEIESEYARTIETYNGILEQKDLRKDVKFLRLGRVAFYYVSEDNKECALYDNKTKSWHKLPTSNIHLLNDAIKVASKKSIPHLLIVPLFTPNKGI
jgi:hypothetical protein